MVIIIVLLVAVSNYPGYNHVSLINYSLLPCCRGLRRRTGNGDRTDAKNTPEMVHPRLVDTPYLKQSIDVVCCAFYKVTAKQPG